VPSRVPGVSAPTAPRWQRRRLSAEAHPQKGRRPRPRRAARAVPSTATPLPAARLPA
jgi:hypothetical protein